MWPILYAFDPAAPGALPVERFREGAEKYGYIVVGSHKSRNGPWAPTLEAAQAISLDTSRRFSIDPSRIYLTGFSGGSRLAARLALSGARVRGAIGCGAGFPTDHLPRELPFAFVGVVGTTDMNLLEMRLLEEALNRSRAAHRLIQFTGGHQWPLPEVCLQAVEWLELQSTREATGGPTPIPSPGSSRSAGPGSWRRREDFWKPIGPAGSSWGTSRDWRIWPRGRQPAEGYRKNPAFGRACGNSRRWSGRRRLTRRAFWGAFPPSTGATAPRPLVEGAVAGAGRAAAAGKLAGLRRDGHEAAGIRVESRLRKTVPVC